MELAPDRNADVSLDFADCSELTIDVNLEERLEPDSDALEPSPPDVVALGVMVVDPTSVVKVEPSVVRVA